MGADLRKIRPHLRITQNMKKIFAFSAFLSLCAAHLPAADVSADFAGDNAVIAASAGGKISIVPDSSGCSRGGNYWNFRVRKASGKLLEISVSGKNAVDACGAFVSEDSGKNWTPLGAHSVRRCGDSAKFSYRVSEDAAEVRFASVIPYLHSDFKRFAQSRGIAIRHFCKTERGRENVFVELGNENSAVTAILTCRHHACESAVSFVLEGFLSSAKYAKNIRVAARLSPCGFGRRRGRRAGKIPQTARPQPGLLQNVKVRRHGNAKTDIGETERRREKNGSFGFAFPTFFGNEQPRHARQRHLFRLREKRQKAEFGKRLLAEACRVLQ